MSKYINYEKCVQVMYLEQLPVNNKSWDQLSKQEQIPCTEENIYKGTQEFIFIDFRVKPEDYENKLKERLAYIKRLYRGKKKLSLTLVEPVKDNLINS